MTALEPPVRRLLRHGNPQPTGQIAKTGSLVPGRDCNRRCGEGGFSLILLSLSLVVMLAMLGLAIDVGRMFVYKNELQTFADASALAAIAQMDGTQTGVQGANSTAIVGPDGASSPNRF